MRRVRAVAFPLIVIFVSCFIPAAHAESKVADCIELKFPTATATSTLITLSVQVYATCTPEELGRGNGQRALYSMEEEESLFNLSSCSGPGAQPRVGLTSGYLGTASCSLRVGNNSVPSPRVGATSTTIRMWFSWDFSAKYISVPHQAIPGRSTSGSGSSSGSSGGTSSPVTKTCLAAPETPTLGVEWNQKGPLFRFSPSSFGEKATLINWSYTLYDSVKSNWDSWADWKDVYPANSGEYQATPESNKSKIAFAVYAVNACGSSGQAREISTRTGVPLTPLIQDELSSRIGVNETFETGEMKNFYELVYSSLQLSLSANSITQSICEITQDKQVEMVSPGECKLEFTSKTLQEKAGSQAKVFAFIVKPNRIPQKIPNINLEISYVLTKGSLTFSTITDAGLEVTFESISDRICDFKGKILFFKKLGKCEINATQDGDEITLPAEMRYFSFQITAAKTSIVCSKGKQTKRVTAINPKCPTGYKIKKSG